MSYQRHPRVLESDLPTAHLEVEIELVLALVLSSCAQTNQFGNIVQGSMTQRSGSICNNRNGRRFCGCYYSFRVSSFISVRPSLQMPLTHNSRAQGRSLPCCIYSLSTAPVPLCAPRSAHPIVALALLCAKGFALLRRQPHLHWCMLTCCYH